jgi:hypothetical protein
LGDPGKELTAGPGFLRRTLLIALLGGLAGAVAVAQRFGWTAGAGFAFAHLWSLANLVVLASILRSATHPAGVQRHRLVGMLLVKVFGLYAPGVWVLIEGFFPVGAVAAGIGFPLLVIFLRAAVRWVMEGSGETRPLGSRTPTDGKTP